MNEVFSVLNSPKDEKQIELPSKPTPKNSKKGSAIEKELKNYFDISSLLKKSHKK